MTPDRIRLDPCAACGTAFPADEGRCPDCGAYRPGHRPPPPGGRHPTPPGGPPTRSQGPQGAEGLEDLFAAFGPMFGGQAGQPVSRRAAWGPMARLFLGRNMGCLVWALALFFGIPLAIGALAGDALGGIAVMLLAVGIAGLALTGWLVWLVKPTRRK